MINPCAYLNRTEVRWAQKREGRGWGGLAGHSIPARGYVVCRELWCGADVKFDANALQVIAEIFETQPKNSVRCTLLALGQLCQQAGRDSGELGVEGQPIFA